MPWYVWLLPGLAVIPAFLLARRPVRAVGRERRLRRARKQFFLEREHLEAKFFSVAAASGKPRGLRWKACDWESEVAFARDRMTGEIAALAGVTIRFEAIEGGDMEGVAAVGNLRNASAVFFYQHGPWPTAGKAVFNL